MNTPFFEGLLGTIAAAEKTGVPVILQHAQVHEAVMAIDDIGPAMVALAGAARHLSCCTSTTARTSTTSPRPRGGLQLRAMIDGSRLPFEENVPRHRQVVRSPRERGFGVEGELGVMTGNENGDPDQGIADETLYTDPEDAAVSCRHRRHRLAASFGTVHGLYHREPELNYGSIARLRAATGVPLVMHGGSGLRRANTGSPSARRPQDQLLHLRREDRV